MKQTMEIRHKSVLPFYGVGLVWLVGALIFPIYKLSDLLIVTGLSLVAFVVLTKVCPDRVELQEVELTTGLEDADELLDLIAFNRARLKAINDRIPDDILSAAILRMEKSCDGIMEQLKAQPKQAPELRRFTKHYLPDAVKVLDLYAELDEKGVSGANAEEIRQQVEQDAETIAQAFENQLDSLYAARALDISTDLDVLKGMLKGQGLV